VRLNDLAELLKRLAVVGGDGHAQRAEKQRRKSRFWRTSVLELGMVGDQDAVVRPIGDSHGWTAAQVIAVVSFGKAARHQKRMASGRESLHRVVGRRLQRVNSLAPRSIAA